MLAFTGGSARSAEDNAYEIVVKEPPREAGDEAVTSQPDSATSATTSRADRSAGVDVDSGNAAEDTLDAAYTALQNQEYDIAYDLFYALAAEDNAQAQYELAALYHRGAGVAIDVARAARWYARAAELGHADAQYRLGNMFLMGEGVRQSDSEAAHWHGQAAQQGHDDAKNNLASLRRISSARTREELEREAAALPPLTAPPKPAPGEKVEKRGFFKRWFGKDDKPAPEPGNSVEASAPQPPPAETSAAPATPAQNTGANSERPAPLANSTAISNYELGLAYALGDTLEQDHEKAFEHFRQSAQAGYAPAQYRLGAAYANGDGAEQDPEQALEWYKKSANQGHTAARRALALSYLNGLEHVAPNKPLALAWYTLLAEDGNQLDVHRRDSLLEELPEAEVEKAERLAQDLKMPRREFLESPEK